MRTYVVLFLAVLSQATGNLFLSKGMRSFASIGEAGRGDLLGALAGAAGSPTIWIGTAFLVVFFALFAAALSWEDLSFVLPVISTEVIVNVAFASYFLHEPVSPKRWLGTLMIAVGVVFIGRSRREGDRQGCGGGSAPGGALGC